MKDKKKLNKKNLSRMILSCFGPKKSLVHTQPVVSIRRINILEEDEEETKEPALKVRVKINFTY